MSRLAPWNQITRQYAGKAPLLSWSRRPDHHNYAQSQANLVEYDINQSNHQTIPHALILLIPPPSLSPQRQSIHHLQSKSKAIRDIKCSYQTDCIQCSLNHTKMAQPKSRTSLYVGLAAAGGVGYYLYTAGGSPKVAEKKFQSTLYLLNTC